ncbi:acyl carrier protein [Stenotrophomonas sp. PS02289]|uniref:acyl carrier protein n=1 Tax=Stenotrophomonas sp. PS02289 TaxID=2991422 RepID=UPI00249BEC7A|nr:acyl carrier protein [Stenotrophomonas sp. PS02289]
MKPRFELNDLRDCIGDHLQRDAREITGQLRLVEDLGIDSLGMHALLIDIEEAGGCIPAPEALERVTTVIELYAAVTGSAVP